MAKTLDLIVKLKALDKLSKPLRDASDAVAKTSKNLKALENTQKQIQGFNKLNRDVNQTAAEMEKARQKVGALQQQLINVKNPTDKLKNAYKEQVQELNRLNQQHEKQKSALANAKHGLERAGIPTKNLAQYNSELSKKISSANGQLEKQRNELNKLAEKEAKLAGLREKHGKDMQHLAMVGASGYAAMNAGKRGLTAGARAIAPGLEFDKEMSNVQALARLNKNDPAMVALRAQAQQLGAETAFTASDAARGQAFLAMAGFTPESIQAAMPGLLNMALAGDLDLGRAADIASNIAGAFKIPANQMTDVADILSKASTTSNTDINMLAETMKYVGPVAQEAGVSLSEAAAMAGLLGNVGIQASESGTVMRAMLLRLAAPTGAAQKQLEKLGIDVKDANGNIKSMPKLLNDVAWATQKLGGGDRLAILKDIFGERPAAGLSELISQAGAGELEKYIDVVKDFQGTSQIMADTKADNLVGDLKGLESAWQNIGITLNDEVGPVLRDTVQSFTGILRETAKWMKDNKELTATLIKGTAAIAALITVVGALMVAFAAIAAPLKILIFSIKMLGITMGLTVAPIYIALGLLAVAAFLIYKNWEPISEFFSNLWDSVSSYTMEKLNALGEWLSEKWQAITAFFNSGWQNILAAFINFSPVGLLYQAFAKLLSYLGVDIPDKLVDAGKAIINGLKEGILSLLPDLTGIMDKLGGLLPDSLKTKLGIHSPSRVFAELGANTMEGYSQGLESEQGYTIAQLSAFGKKVAATAAGVTLTGAVAASPMNANQGASYASQGDTITINVYAQQGQSAQDIAAEIERVLNQRQRREAIRQNSRLGE